MQASSLFLKVFESGLMAAGFRYAVSRCLLQAVQLIDQPSAGFELPAGLLVTVLQERMVFRRSVYLFEIAGAYRAVSIYSISLSLIHI